MFKKFESFNHSKYVITNSNSIYQLNDEEYFLDENEFKDILDEKIVPKEMQLLPNESRIEPNILIIEVTNACNFRCEYCIFSGNYENHRTHGTEIIGLSQCDKIVEFINKTPSIDYVTFYGGEPLLAYERIQYIVDNIKLENVHFSFTTNGSLLNEEIIDYLIKNQFNVVLSFDGINQTLHRKTVDKNISSSKLLYWCEYIKNIDEEFYYSHVGFNATLAPPYNLYDNAKLFNENDLFKNNTISISFVDNKDCNLEFLINTSQDEKNTFIKEYRMLMDEYVYQNPKKNFHKGLFDYYMSILLKRTINESDKISLNGCCVPGQRRLYISLNGYLYPCERVNELYTLGTFENIDELTQESFRLEEAYYQIGKERCSECWMANLCDMCFAGLSGPKFEDSSFDDSCNEKKTQMELMLSLFVSCMEYDSSSLDYLLDVVEY